MAKQPLKRGRPRLRADEVKNFRYSIRIDKELNDKLEKHSSKNNITITETIRRAIEEYVD